MRRNNAALAVSRRVHMKWYRHVAAFCRTLRPWPIEAEPCPRVLGREIAATRKRMVLAACVLASSMAFIADSALTVALPKLRAFFDADLRRCNGCSTAMCWRSPR